MAEIWEQIKTFFTSNYLKILIWLATLAIGLIIVKLVSNIVRKVLARSKLEKVAISFIVGLIKVILYLILVLVLLTQMGVEITGILTACSAILLAIGVALEGNISNFANGIVIIVTKMFKKGDYIIVNGVEGIIEDVHFLFTVISTIDGKRVIVPNNIIVNNSLTNVSANSQRRVDITFSVAYETDTDLVKKIVTDVMRSNGKVYDDDKHPIFCKLKTLNSSSLDFFSYCWVDKEDYWDVYYYVLDKVYNEFKKNGVSVPFTQIEVRQRTDEVVMPYDASPLGPREEKVRVSNEKQDFVDYVKEKTKNRKEKREAKNKENN